jgi:hypothetical protein
MKNYLDILSHAWKYKFLDVVDTLKYYFMKEEQVEPNKIILWFDLFSNNQHLNGFHVAPPFCWWCGTFMQAIKKIGRTVMVLSFYLFMKFNNLFCLNLIFYYYCVGSDTLE